MRNLLFLTFSLPLFANISTTPTTNLLQEKQLWLSGTLLSLGTYTTDPGIVDFDPSLYFTTLTGFYDSQRKIHSIEKFYSTELTMYSYFGITSFLDFAIAPGIVQQFTQGEQYTGVTDMPFGFDIQIWKPNILLFIGATVPFGKYDHFNPNKKNTDLTGYGSWSPMAALAIDHTFIFSPTHALNPQFSIGYTIPTSVSVKGFNSYGGGYGTKGIVHPGKFLWWDLALQYTLTKNWTLATDLFYHQDRATSFSGNPGELSPGVLAKVGYPAFSGMSLAPAIGYNWSENMSLVGGVWFSLTGKNDFSFISGDISFQINL